MQKNPDNTESSEIKLIKACEHVNDFWFPINSELLGKIKKEVNEGKYDQATEDFISELTSDFSLYMYSLRELMKMFKAEGINCPNYINPVDYLRQAGIDRLKKIISSEEYLISKHSFGNNEPFQIQTIGEAIISASCAEVLADSFEVNKEIGFSAALIRQLGHTLIAWNYPSFYEKALHNVAVDKSIDVAIAEQLGFSPTLLSLKVISSWGINNEFCKAIFQNYLGAGDEDSLTEALGVQIVKLCEVGEALARANNPRLYPSARQDWIFSKEQIEKRLGQDGMSVIQEALVENLNEYLHSMPELFALELVLEPDLKLSSNDHSKVIIKNPYLNFCNSYLQDKLSAIYANINYKNIKQENIISLIRTIIPESGFNGGYVYTADPGINMLVAQTKISRPKIKNFKSVDYSIVGSDSSSIAVAFRSAEPVIEFHSLDREHVYVGISGGLGSSNRFGVLYLEMPHDQYVVNESLVINHFKAISRTIADCLRGSNES